MSSQHQATTATSWGLTSKNRVTRRSAQRAGDLADLGRRVHAAEWGAGHQVLAHGQPADENGLEADLADEALGRGDRLGIVAGDGNADGIAGAMREPAELRGADRVEPPDDVRAG